MNIPNLIFTDLPDYVTHGNYFSIATGCTFLEAAQQHLAAVNHKCVYTTNYGQPLNAPSKITFGHDVWVGTGVHFIAPVNVGNGAIIGAYSVIAKDVPAYAVVVGNPQVVKRYRFTPEQIEKLEKIQWWNWEEDILMERMKDLQDVDVFIKKYIDTD